MRPITRLPFRDALYVCSNCRQGATPRRISPITHQLRGYASSDSPSFLDRTRRNLWKGDKPPGQEDPYTGQSQLAPGAGQAESQSEEALSQGTLGGTEKKAYQQAETWDELEVVGWETEPVPEELSEADHYSRYGAEVDSACRVPAAAAHQAAVEGCLMRMLGKDPVSICEVVNHDEQIQELIDKCVVEGSEPWTTALRFPDQQTMDALVFVFNQIGEQTETEIKSPENFLLKSETPSEGSASQTHRTLSLNDPENKFYFVKRFTQLTSRRVSDKSITSSKTIGHILSSLNAAAKKQPTNVTDLLAKQRAQGALPANLHFQDSRISKFDKDEDLGRKKAIYAEFYRRGIVDWNARQ